MFGRKYHATTLYFSTVPAFPFRTHAAPGYSCRQRRTELVVFLYMNTVRKCVLNSHGCILRVHPTCLAQEDTIIHYLARTPSSETHLKYILETTKPEILIYVSTHESLDGNPITIARAHDNTVCMRTRRTHSLAHNTPITTCIPFFFFSSSRLLFWGRFLGGGGERPRVLAACASYVDGAAWMAQEQQSTHHHTTHRFNSHMCSSIQRRKKYSVWYNPD